MGVPRRPSWSASRGRPSSRPTSSCARTVRSASCRRGRPTSSPCCAPCTPWRRAGARAVLRRRGPERARGRSDDDGTSGYRDPAGDGDGAGDEGGRVLPRSGRADRAPARASASSWPRRWRACTRSHSRTWRRRRSDLDDGGHGGVDARGGGGHGGAYRRRSAGRPSLPFRWLASGCSTTCTTSFRRGGSASCKATSDCTTCSSTAIGSPRWSTGRRRRSGRPLASSRRHGRRRPRSMAWGEFVDAYRAAGGPAEATEPRRGRVLPRLLRSRRVHDSRGPAATCSAPAPSATS